MNPANCARDFTIRIGAKYVTVVSDPPGLTGHRFAAFHWRSRESADAFADRLNAGHAGNNAAIVEVLPVATTRSLSSMHATPNW